MKYDIEKSLTELEGLSLLDFCFDNDIVAFKSGFGDYIVLLGILSVEIPESTAQKIYKIQKEYHRNMKAENWAKGQFGNAGDD